MPSKPERKKELRRRAAEQRRQRRKEMTWKERYGDLYTRREPIRPKIEISAATQQRREESRKKRFAELLAQNGGHRASDKRICKHPHHAGLDRRIPEQFFNPNSYLCVDCLTRDSFQAKSFAYLEKVGMARDKLISAIVEGKLGTGTLKDFYHAGLKMFGGIEGLVGCIKAEYDAADAGSQIRKQYLEMFVKVMVALSTMGQEEDYESLPDDEIAQRAMELSQEAVRRQEQDA